MSEFFVIDCLLKDHAGLCASHNAQNSGYASLRFGIEYRKCVYLLLLSNIVVGSDQVNLISS